MSLRHLPTNAGQGRPAEFSGAVAANRSTAFGASGVIPWMGRRAWDRGGLDDSRLLRTGSYSSPPERAQILRPASFCSAHGPRLIGGPPLFLFRPEILMPAHHIPN